MAKILKRKMGGLQAQKFQFDVEILRGLEVPADEAVYICWTRGAHLATTKERTVDMKGNVTFGEKLSLLCTMYQSSSGKFQEKMSKLAFKIKKKSKSVASYKFDLSQYVQGPEYTSPDMELEMTSDGGMFSSEKAGGKLVVKISSRFLPPDAAGDTFTDMSGSEAVSQMSIGEDLSDDEDEGGKKPGQFGSISMARKTAAGSNPYGEANSTSTEELQMSQTKVAQLEEVSNSATKLNLKLEEELQSKTEEACKYKNEMDSLGASNIELQTRKQSIEATLSDRQAEISRLQGEKEDTAQKNTQECAALMARIEALESGGGKGDSEESMAFARQLQEQLAKKEHDIAEMHHGTAEMQNSMHQVEADRSRLEAELEKEADGHQATTIERDTLLHEVNRGSSGLAAAASIAASDREKNTLLDDKIALQKEVAALQVQLAQRTGSQNFGPVSMEGASEEVAAHIGYLESELVTTKISWAQAEEEKDLAWFKVRDVKKQLQKAHETNRSFAKRMTQLEVSLSTEKQKAIAQRGGNATGGGNPF